MALEVVGGAFLSALFQEIFHKMASREVMDFIKGKKQTKGLLNKLKMTLRSVNAVLDDAEEKQLSDSDVKEWLDELKEAVFDAEDLLNEIKTEVMRSKLEAEQYGSSTGQLQQLISASFHTFDKSIDPKIEEILERLDFIASQKDALNLKTGCRYKLPQRVLLPSTSLVDDSGVYGRYRDKETIAKLLLLNDAGGNKVGVVPIVGMGGIGKTTLAQLLYNDVRVKQNFDLLAWVCVSENFDVVRITQTIYGSVTSSICAITDLNLLQVNLKEALMGKKFLFVLDDVWNENYIQWDVLRCPFEFGMHGSRIIVTTRNEGVASMMGTLPTHHLLLMSEEDCLLLFSKHAFKNADVSANPTLEVTGKQIVKKCKGLPLAAKSLGGLLCSTLNIDEWEKILESDIWELPYKESTILPALWLSYYYLPQHLKRCFAYCSIFPKGFVFERSELVLLWMAEDLLQSKNKKIVEEVGEEYFDNLISRSFFQRSSTGFNCFTMHDLISDLAKFVSGEFCLRLEEDDNSFNILTKTRHLSYMRNCCNGFEKFDALHEARYLRTFLPLQRVQLWSERFQMLDKVLHDLLPTLRCLRVLNLSRYDIRKLPNSISNLKHLRYLNLSWTSIEKLPDTICTLYSLQTLLLSHCEALAHLPTNLGRLTNLRHLDIGDIGGTNLEKMPPQIGKLKDLQMLSDFVLDKPNARNDILELKELKHLHGTLRISRLQNIVNAVDALEANMREKKSLTHLILEFGGYTEDSQKDREVLDNLQPHSNLKELTIDSYRGTRFPGWLGDHSSSNLVHLDIVKCTNCCFLPPLGHLLSLRELHIDGLNGVVSIGPEFYGNDAIIKPFKSLQILEFKNMRRWQEWSYVGDNKEGGVFPSLSRLHLEDCPKLMGILPLDYFPMLQSLRVLNANIESLTMSQGSICPKMSSLKMYDCWNFVCFPDGGLHAPNLTAIDIDGCTNLRSLPEHMNTLLRSLESISIGLCPELESFPEGGLPPELKSLNIRSCKKLFANRMQWGLQELTSLEVLTVDFIRCEEVESFPEEGLMPITLTSLSIYDLLNVKTMEGKELRHLSSLARLSIMGCPELQCLPDEGLPTSLCYLRIEGCPLLKQRCQRDQGEDWPKISHIPNIWIDGNRYHP